MKMHMVAMMQVFITIIQNMIICLRNILQHTMGNIVYYCLLKIKIVAF